MMWTLHTDIPVAWAIVDREDITSTGKVVHVNGLTRSAVVTKETGTTLPEDGLPVTRT
jgi:hypothetical protein